MRPSLPVVQDLGCVHRKSVHWNYGLFQIPLNTLASNHGSESNRICQCYKLKSNYYICSVKGSSKVVKLISSQNDKVNKHRNFRPFSINFYFHIFPVESRIEMSYMYPNKGYLIIAWRQLFKNDQT